MTAGGEVTQGGERGGSERARAFPCPAQTKLLGHAAAGSAS